MPKKTSVSAWIVPSSILIFLMIKSVNDKKAKIIPGIKINNSLVKLLILGLGKLKQKRFTSSWREIVRIMNT